MLPLVIRVMDTKAQTSKEYCFTHSPVRIGRNSLNDISIQEPFVSLFHAVIRFEEEELHLVDLGSTNGTLVNGKRVAKNAPVRMQAGATVNIGHVSLRFSRGNFTQPRERSSSQMTQFRALSSLRAQLGEELAPAEPLDFTPTPIQERPSYAATSLLPQLPSKAPEPDVPEDTESPRTTLMAAPDIQAMVAARSAESLRPAAPGKTGGAKPATSPEQPRRRTLSGSSRVVVPSVPQTSSVRSAKLGVINKLVPLYNDYRSAWDALHSELSGSVEGLGEEERTEAFSQLSMRMPALLQEEQFRQFARSMGIELPDPAASASQPVKDSGSNRLEVVSRELLGQFVRSYLPNARGLESERDIDRFLERLAEVLETFGRAFLELRQGHDQFGQQMAVPVTSDPSPLYRAKNTRDVMQYLLDWRVDGSRVQELMSGFVDVMIHQIALLNGMREGVRGMLQRLSPEVLEAGAGRSTIQMGPLKIPARLWPFRGSRRWAEYVERHRAFMEEERELTAALFGPEFAKAYMAIIGDAAKKGAGDGEPPDALPAPKAREREDR